MKPHNRSFFVVFLAFGILLAACGTLIPTQTPVPLIPSTATDTAEPTLLPSATPTPPPPLAVLLAPAGSDAELANTWQTALHAQITSAGLRWQVRQRLNPEDLTPELRLVIVLPPDPGIVDLAAAAPQAQFLAVQLPGVQAGGNLSTIGASGSRPDQQGFLAGYIAAMLTPDWRVAAISLSDTLEGKAARTGFMNGAIFFCGLCNPDFPPPYDYPFYLDLPATASSIEWQSLANFMIDHFVKTVYVFPGAGDPVMLNLLAQADVRIISSGAPTEDMRPAWIASLNTDVLPLVQSLIPELLQGNGGQALPLPITLNEIDTEYLSPGKLALVEKIMRDLQAGYIDTGVDLTTGENN